MKSRLHRERGTVLVMGLLILVLVTLLSASAIRSTVLEEHMVGNQRNTNLAFQAAEGALRQGEADLMDDKYFNVTHADFWNDNAWATDDDESEIDKDGLYSPDEAATKTTVDPQNGDRYAFSLPDGTISGVVSQPSYYLERIEGVPMPRSSIVTGFGLQNPMITFYRVTARGEGMNDKVETVLQSTFFR